MEFLVWNVVYKIVGLLIAFLIIWFVVKRFRVLVLKDEISRVINKSPTAVAIYEGLLFIGMVLLANKVIP